MSLPLDTPATPRAPVLHATRPFYWSVRREIWESRSIYMAPAIVAGVVLLAYLIGFSRGAGKLFGGLQPVVFQDHGGTRTLPTEFFAALPFEVLAAIISIAGVVVGLFYCLGALHNERRDRSILFWKSLPVSNLTSVLAKAATPMLAIPLAVFVIVSAAQLVTLVLCLVAAAPHPGSVPTLLAAQPFGRGSLVLIYANLALALWFAPIYGWLLLVSAWAKNMTFLWAVAPPIVLGVFERIAFGTNHVQKLINDRLFGLPKVAFSPSSGTQMDLANLDLVGLLSSPALWLGVVVAALMIAAVVWLRRRTEPL